jgi:hypothetical protein
MLPAKIYKNNNGSLFRGLADVGKDKTTGNKEENDVSKSEDGQT